MILVVADKKSNRLIYITKILFEYILKDACIVCNEQEMRPLLGRYPTCSVLFYLSDFKNKYGEDKIGFEPSSLLLNDAILEEDLKIIVHSLFELPDVNNLVFENDYLLASFVILTEYEKYLSKAKDKNGRYDETKLVTSDKSILANPYLHLVADHIYKVLEDRNPLLNRGYIPNAIKYSMDIDRPYLYSGADKKYIYSSLLKNLMMYNKNYFNAAFQFINTGKDKYEISPQNWKWIQINLNSAFFLVQSFYGVDSNYPLLNAEHIKLIKKFDSDTDAEIGIHPSFNSYLDPTKIIEEKKKLENIINKEIKSARMHFLKYSLPETYQFLILAGIKNQHDGVCYSQIGYKYGIGIPFPWFDVSKNEETDLIIHPYLMMDRTLLSYLNLSPEEASTIVTEFKNQSKLQGTEFSMLIHNDIFSKFEEWEGWENILKIENSLNGI